MALETSRRGLRWLRRRRRWQRRRGRWWRQRRRRPRRRRRRRNRNPPVYLCTGEETLDLPRRPSCHPRRRRSFRCARCWWRNLLAVWSSGRACWRYEREARGRPPPPALFVSSVVAFADAAVAAATDAAAAAADANDDDGDVDDGASVGDGGRWRSDRYKDWLRQ